MRPARMGMAAIVLLVSLLVPQAVDADGCEGCDCDEQWWAGYNGDHNGCTAGGIVGGSVSYCGGTLWRHHTGVFTKSTDSDKDCHCTKDCDYEDVAETSFTCSWKIQKYDSAISDFVDDGVIGSANCGGANWDTTNHEPGVEYRAKCFINDTSGDGPHGDDAGVYRYSGGVVLWAPYPVNFQQSPTVNCVEDQGVMQVWHFWESSCGHNAHLDLVTVREWSTYEPEFTTGTCHDSSHGGANCFTIDLEDPTVNGVPGSDGGLTDVHVNPGPGAYAWNSYCQCSQTYEWATDWDTRPGERATDVSWPDLATYMIKRYVEPDDDNPPDGKQYRIEKGEATCVWGLTQ